MALPPLSSLVALALVGAGFAACEPKPKEAPAKTEAAPPPAAAPAEPEPVAYHPRRRAIDAEQQSLVFDSPITTLAGNKTSLAAFRGKTLMVVNVASECGNTPQYEQLQALQNKYETQGFTVVAFPCNQFGAQEPGTKEEIRAFAEDNYHVTFPLMQKLETNGANRHPIYQALTQIKDDLGEAGDIQWNFEKFLVSADGEHVTRIRPGTLPDDPAVLKMLAAELGHPE